MIVYRFPLSIVFIHDCYILNFGCKVRRDGAINHETVGKYQQEPPKRKLDGELPSSDLFERQKRSRFILWQFIDEMFTFLLIQIWYCFESVKQLPKLNHLEKGHWPTPARMLMVTFTASKVTMVKLTADDQLLSSLIWSPFFGKQDLEQEIQICKSWIDISWRKCDKSAFCPLVPDSSHPSHGNRRASRNLAEWNHLSTASTIASCSLECCFHSVSGSYTSSKNQT